MRGCAEQGLEEGGSPLRRASRRAEQVSVRPFRDGVVGPGSRRRPGRTAIDGGSASRAACTTRVRIRGCGRLREGPRGVRRSRLPADSRTLRGHRLLVRGLRADLGRRGPRAPCPIGSRARTVTVTASQRAISFLSGDTPLEGSALVPSDARGIVVFAHGSRSGRQSPRNRHVAAVLNEAGLATTSLSREMLLFSGG